MNIRKARKSDLEGICNLSYEINKTHAESAPIVFKPVSEVGADRHLWEKVLQKKNGITLVAENENCVIAFVTAVIEQNVDIVFLQEHKLCRVGTIVVSGSEQKSGVGSQLMIGVERWALEQGASEIRLEVMEFNTHAQNFYSKHGYCVQSKTMSRVIA